MWHLLKGSSQEDAASRLIAVRIDSYPSMHTTRVQNISCGGEILVLVAIILHPEFCSSGLSALEEWLTFSNDKMTKKGSKQKELTMVDRKAGFAMLLMMVNNETLPHGS